MPKKTYAAAIIERADQSILIATLEDRADGCREWQFPRAIVRPGQSPEAAIRREVEDSLDLAVEITLGQPPFHCQADGQEVELRYFFCELSEGNPTRGPFAEVQWIAKMHLCEYDFDWASQPVANWILSR